MILDSDFLASLARLPNYSKEFEKAFLVYKKNLLIWNQKHNLIGRSTVDLIEQVHFSASLSLYPYLQNLSSSNVLDLGTGAGLPGLPLAITLPKLSFYLVDSVEKKIAFLKDTISRIEINNAEAVAARAEQLSLRFDVVICRSVASIDRVVNLTYPLLNKNAKIFVLKTESFELTQDIDCKLKDEGVRSLGLSNVAVSSGEFGKTKTTIITLEL